MGMSLIIDNIEDKDRGLYKTMSIEETKKIKVYGETCIGYGRYPIELYNSPKHGWCYLLKETVGFDFVEIHPANKATQLLGCLAPGKYTEGKKDWVSFSKSNTKKLEEIIKKYNIKFVEILKR
jgi:hypothetical protein